MPRKILEGIVLSAKSNKTASILISRRKKNRKYRKNIQVDKKYLAHDKNNICKIGDIVRIKETKPFSRNKKWIISV